MNNNLTTKTIAVVPKWQGTFEALCAEMLIHFGRAVECVKEGGTSKINCYIYGEISPKDCSLYRDYGHEPCIKYCKGKSSIFSIHIARAFVLYCEWVKRNKLSKDIDIAIKNNINEDILMLYVGALINWGKTFNITKAFNTFAKAHKIDLAQAVDIVLGVG